MTARPVRNLGSFGPGGSLVAQADALGAYAYCNVNAAAASYPGKGNCVAIYSLAVAASTGSLIWGSNFFVSDSPTTATFGGSQNRSIRKGRR